MATVGIYQIKHVPSNKTYVGQSNNVSSRLSKHRLMLKNGDHHCKELNELWRSNRGSNFRFEVIEISDGELQGVELQNWLIDRERYHYSLLSKQGLCLNATFPALVHAGNSHIEELENRKIGLRNNAADAESKRRIVASKLSAKENELEECNRLISMYNDILSQTSGFFTFIKGQSNPAEAARAKAALEPLFARRIDLLSERYDLYSLKSDLEMERRRNNSTARRLGSQQRIIKARKKSRKKNAN